MTTKENSTKSDRSTGILMPSSSSEKLAPRRNYRRLDSRLSNFYFVDRRLFGRRRGNGMGPRSKAVLCTSVVSWAEAGMRKAAIASSVWGFRAGAALGIEPVVSSVAGGCLPLLVSFRSPKTPNTRMASPATPSRVRWLRVSMGMAKRCRTIEHPNPRRRPFCCGNGNFTVPVLTVS